MSKNSKSNQRADVKNPNNSAYKAAIDNRSVQLDTGQTTAKPEPSDNNTPAPKK